MSTVWNVELAEEEEKKKKICIKFPGLQVHQTVGYYHPSHPLAREGLQQSSRDQKVAKAIMKSKKIKVCGSTRLLEEIISEKERTGLIPVKVSPAV